VPLEQTRGISLLDFPLPAVGINSIAQLIDAGRCAAVALVKEEIDSVGTPGLQTWAKSHANLFVPLAPDIQHAGVDHCECG
jgi:hypothetical protein